ncbi:hypothetical protein ANAEL_00383 [Anaerolineales bacterium]|nr:hypothetical protein ANAEL_00383 [Anaerolineales bacterium]
MQIVQRFFAWFSSQKLFVKVALGCLSLFIFCCLCSITIFILIPTTPTPEAENTLVVEIEPSPIFPQSENSTEAPTIAPTTTSKPINTSLPSTSTPNPTNTSLPPTATPTTSEALIDVYSILGKPVNEVEAILGSTILITPNDDADEVLVGGEWRDYKLEKYTVMVSYDKNGVARIFTITDGLSDENYSPTQWNNILPQFGVYVNVPPERTAPMAVYWDNYQGYFIAVAGDPVWTVQIAEVGYRP